MQQINQKQHRQSIINHNCDKVVHCRDQRAGRNRRVYIDLLEEHRDQCADHTGDHHRCHKRDSDTAGDKQRMVDRISLITQI